VIRGEIERRNGSVYCSFSDYSVFHRLIFSGCKEKGVGDAVWPISIRGGGGGAKEWIIISVICGEGVLK